MFICFYCYFSLYLKICVIQMKPLVDILYGLALFVAGMILSSIYTLLTVHFKWPVVFVYMTSLLPIFLPACYFILKYAIRRDPNTPSPTPAERLRRVQRSAVANSFWIAIGKIVLVIICLPLIFAIFFPFWLVVLIALKK